jgi:hypothetical protein
MAMDLPRNVERPEHRHQGERHEMLRHLKTDQLSDDQQIPVERKLIQESRARPITSSGKSEGL